MAPDIEGVISPVLTPINDDGSEEVGYDAPALSVRLARHYPPEGFDAEYCERHVRRLMSEAGLF